MSEQHSGANPNASPILEKAMQEELAKFANSPMSAAKINEVISSIAAQRFIEELDNSTDPKSKPENAKEFFKQEAAADHTIFGIQNLEMLHAAGGLDSTYVTPQKFVESTNDLLVKHIRGEQFSGSDKERAEALEGVQEAQREMIEF